MIKSIVMDKYKESALTTIDIEIEALNSLRSSLDIPSFSEALGRTIEAIAHTDGRVILSGMGKSGLIGRKIAATLRSTGTPSAFLHPGEASHGDLGLVTEKDVVLAISWSGETAELKDLFYYCNRFNITLVVATAYSESTAAKIANICIVLPQVREACPNELAPTSSTTVQLVLGDILAVGLMEHRGFSSQDFRTFHPGGKLGAQLQPVDHIMGTGDAIPRVSRHDTLSSATIEMSRKRYGATAVVDGDDKLVGVFTDGDLRRCIMIHDMQDKIHQHMSTSPVTVPPGTLCTEALQIMNSNAVSVVFVENEGRLEGIVHMHDIIRTGVA